MQKHLIAIIIGLGWGCGDVIPKYTEEEIRQREEAAAEKASRPYCYTLCNQHCYDADGDWVTDHPYDVCTDWCRDHCTPDLRAAPDEACQSPLDGGYQHIQWSCTPDYY